MLWKLCSCLCVLELKLKQRHNCRMQGYPLDGNLALSTNVQMLLSFPSQKPLFSQIQQSPSSAEAYNLDWNILQQSAQPSISAFSLEISCLVPGLQFVLALWTESEHDVAVEVYEAGGCCKNLKFGSSHSRLQHVVETAQTQLPLQSGVEPEP